jgi:hypothetical protein
MYPAIKPGSTPSGSLPELGHTPNREDNVSSNNKKKLEKLIITDKKN